MGSCHYVHASYLAYKQTLAQISFFQTYHLGLSKMGSSVVLSLAPVEIKEGFTVELSDTELD